MAENKSSRAIVAEAERELFGPIAEAQSLMALYRDTQDFDAWACLAAGTMERWLEKWDEYHHLLLVHGRQKVQAMKRKPLGKMGEVPVPAHHSGLIPLRVNE